MNFPFPLMGLNKGVAVDQQPQQTSSYLNNVRAYDTLDTRKRGGVRPGVDKKYSQQIGAVGAVVAMTEITVIT